MHVKRETNSYIFYHNIEGQRHLVLSATKNEPSPQKKKLCTPPGKDIK